MHDLGTIDLVVCVLNETGPDPQDCLFKNSEVPLVKWFGGNRRKFTLALLTDSADVRLLDHVGIGRVPGMLPALFTPRYLLFIHGVEIWNNSRADYLRTAQKAEMLIVNSEFTAKKVLKRSSEMPDMRVCWPGKDRALPESTAQASMGEAHGPHAMLIVGRLSASQRHKGHDHLLEALPEIIGRVPDAQLVITGRGDDKARLEEKARQLGVAHNVTFTGWVDDLQLHELYRQCALFVMPSEGDGFGMVFLEAMMHSKPCVGLKTGSAAEVLEEGKTGILVDREDRTVMAQQISELLLDKAQREQMGKAGYERYQAHFTAKHYSERLRRILLEYLNR